MELATTLPNRLVTVVDFVLLRPPDLVLDLVTVSLFRFFPPEIVTVFFLTPSFLDLVTVRLTDISNILCQQITMNYLKYWRVVRYFINAKYGITQPDLEMLIFLYDEPYFTRAKFKEFDKVFSWDKDRFNRLVKNGWVEKVSVQSKSRLGVYNLTYKAKRVVGYAYALIEGKEFPTDDQNNPVFKRDVSFTDKMYRNVMMEINEAQRQHRVQK